MVFVLFSIKKANMNKTKTKKILSETEIIMYVRMSKRRLVCVH